MPNPLLAATAAALLVFAQATVGEIALDGERYLHAREETRGDATTHEYVRASESLSDWTQRIAVEIHPKAANVTEVMSPYAKERQSRLLHDVEVFKKVKSPHAEDMTFEFMLAPADGSHIEISFVRAISNPSKPVVLYVFSHKIAAPDRATMEAGMRAAAKKRQDWIRAIGEISTAFESGGAPQSRGGSTSRAAG